MATASGVLMTFPFQQTVESTHYVSGAVYSTTSAFLTGLRSWLVSTVGWTLIDTGVSGQPENFVVRSSGTSGDRLIYLKFGVSSLGVSLMSCFACVSFNATTDAASNPTDQTAQSFCVNANSGLRVWLKGSRNFVFLGMELNQRTANWHIGYDGCAWYGGLADEFVSSVSQTPTRVLAYSLEANAAAIVEGASGTFNPALIATEAVPWYTDFVPTPDLISGRYLVSPALVTVNTLATIGMLRQVYLTYAGQGNPNHLSRLMTASHTYLVFSNTNRAWAVLWDEP